MISEKIKKNETRHLNFVQISHTSSLYNTSEHQIYWTITQLLAVRLVMAAILLLPMVFNILLVMSFIPAFFHYLSLMNDDL